jgi:hypothetical protein
MQNAISLLPIVALSVDVDANTFTIRNFGKGSAFNLALKPLSGTGQSSLSFEHPEVLAPGEERPATPKLWRPVTGKSVADLLPIRDELRRACPVDVYLTYKDGGGIEYCTEQRIITAASGGNLLIQYVRQANLSKL